MMETGWREISPNCPRCGSSNTKFCYYNNYSLTQPRYFCKGCRRYWTRGGSLRNIPVGGGCRKSRRSRSLSSSVPLRLPTSTNHHNGHLNPSRTTTSSTMFGNWDHNGNNNMVESTTSLINSEAPTIDLAVVYANFLNQKPNSTNNDDAIVVKLPQETYNGLENPSQQQQQQRVSVVDCVNNLTLSQGLSLPHLGNDNEHSQIFVGEITTPINHHHHEEISIDEELGLPPLPGESSSWAPLTSSYPNDHHATNLQAPRLPDFEPDSDHFSNLIIGSWSPLDFTGFETSSSSSKP